MLEIAKRSGKAHLFVKGGKSLPSPYQLTGDPRWDEDGEFYKAYDLQLDEGNRGGDQPLTLNGTVTSEPGKKSAAMISRQMIAMVLRC